MEGEEQFAGQNRGSNLLMRRKTLIITLFIIQFNCPSLTKKMLARNKSWIERMSEYMDGPKEQGLH